MYAMISGNRGNLVTILFLAIVCSGSYFIWSSNVISTYIQRMHIQIKPPKPLMQRLYNPENKTKYLSIKPKHCSVQGMRKHCTGSKRKELLGVYQCKRPNCACYPEEIVLLPTGTFNDSDFLPVAEMLPIEKEMLNDEEFVDINNTASTKNSKVFLVEPAKSFRVGDRIKVQINLIDGVGRQRLVGGDDVRAWMKSSNGIYKASGDVVDLKNGTYIATFKALWSGESTFHIGIPYTRESIASMLKWRREYRTLFYYYGVYQKGSALEHVICSMYSTIPGYSTICNLTQLNDNYPWFCGKPLNPVLTCEDFILANDFDNTELPLTEAEYITFDRTSFLIKLPTTLKLNISKGNAKVQQNLNCNELPVRETWNTTMPTGYFKHNEWKSLKCQNQITKRTLMSCFKNATVILYGDSTTRQWYTALLTYTKCNQTTEKWTSNKWYSYSVCESEALNFTLIWNTHVFPIPNGYKKPNGKLNLKSAVTSLNELPSTGKVIFVLHYYCHFGRQHYTLYRNHIRSLKEAIRNALKRNKEIQIAIKSPHVFYNTECASCLSDFQGKIFIDILQKEFEEFKDSVWYLNFWDMNTSIENGPIHPVNEVVWENLQLLFGYVCK